MLDRLRSHLQSTGLIPEGSRVLVGYSGGADSTCLLHMLHELQVDVVAAHLHHGQRPEAEREMRLCEAFADSLGIPFVAGRADVPAIAQEHGIGLEEAGREARYSFFRQAAFRLDTTLVATGHTRDDLVETVLLHVTRGAGLAGLGGIPARRHEIVRPLLPFTRQETRDYCDSRALWYHDDPANVDISFSRARIRHRVLPELRTINPQADEALARLSHIASEEDKFLNGMAAAALEQAEIPLNGDLQFITLDVEASFNANVLRHYPSVLLRRSIRLAVETLGGGLSFDQTDLVESGLRDESKGSVTVEGAAVAVDWDAEHLHIRELTPTEPFRHPVTLPGEVVSDEFGWILEAEQIPALTHEPVRRALEVELSAASLKGPLYFRSSQPGDQMNPLGFEHRRKVSDILGEAKLTQAAKCRLPIICDLVGPVWIPGVCMDERVRPTSGPAVRLKLSPLLES